MTGIQLAFSLLEVANSDQLQQASILVDVLLWQGYSSSSGR